MEARDGGSVGQQLSSVCVVFVRVLDTDIVVPEFLSSLYTIAVPENATIGGFTE